MADFLSLEAAKAHLNEDGNDDIDDELQGFIAAAIEVLEDLTRETIVRREFEQTVELSRPTAAVWLHHFPAVELVEVTDGVNPRDLDGFALTPSGQLLAAGGGLLSGTLKIRYLAGLDEGWPAKRVMAAKMLLLHWWQTQRTSYGGGSANRYGGSDGGDGMVMSGGFAIPRAVLEMLGPRTPNLP